MKCLVCVVNLLVMVAVCSKTLGGEPVLSASFDGPHEGEGVEQATTAPGRTGNAISLESAKDFVRLPIAKGFPYKAGTLDFWMCLNEPWATPAPKEYFSVLQVVGTPDYWNAFFVSIQPSRKKLYFSIGSDPWSVPNRWNANQSVNSSIAEWKPGEWHRVTVSWGRVNAGKADVGKDRSMTLFVDGVRKGVNHMPSTITHVGTSLYIGLGPSRAPAFQSRVDDLSLWSGVLLPSEVEAQSAAASSDPSATWPVESPELDRAPVDQEVSLVSSPLSVRLPKVNGVLQPNEWVDASETTGLLDEMGVPECDDVRIFTKYDEKALYVAVRALIPYPVPESSKTVRKSGTPDYEVILRVQPEGGAVEAFSLNTCDGRRQTVDGPWAGQCVVEDSGEVGGSALTFAKTIWSAEFAIPFDTLARATPVADEAWGFDLQFSFPVGQGKDTPMRTLRWAIPGETALEGGHGQICFRPTLRVVSNSCDLHEIVRGDVKLGVEARDGADRIDAYAFVRFVSPDREHRVKDGVEKTFAVSYAANVAGEKTIESSFLFKESHEQTLVWGLSDVRSQASLFRRAVRLTTKPSILVTPTVIYGKSLLDISVDARLVVDGDGPVACVATLFPEDSAAAVESWTLPPSTNALMHGLFDIAAIAPGTYHFEVIVGDPELPLARIEKDLTIYPKPDWWENDLGKSDLVPAPWTPVSVTGITVDVWNRQYAFASQPFPSQIMTGDRPFLTGPITVEVHDEAGAVTWAETTVSVVHASETEATLAVDVPSARFTLEGKVCVEFDGFMRIDWSLKPKAGEVNLTLIKLHVPIIRERALYLRAASLADFRADDYWEHYACLYPTGPSKYPKRHTVNKKWEFSAEGWLWPERFNHEAWIGDDTGGLSIMFDSDRNFDTDEYMRPVSNGATTDLQITFRNRPFTLREPLRFSMAMQATPVKPLPKDPKRWRVSYRGEATPEGALNLALAVRYSIFRGPGWLEMTPEGKALHASWAKGGVRLTGDNYSNISTAEMPEFGIFGKEWEIVPRIAWGFGHRGTGVMVSMKGSYADFYLWGMNRLIDQGIRGIYIDSSGVLSSENAFNDSGYIDSTGERKATINLFETREAYKRLYRLFKSRVPDSVIWAHPVPITALASFVDITCSGEEWTNGGEDVGVLTPDFFRAAYMVCAYRGIPYLFYPGQPRGYPDTVSYEDMLPISLAHNVFPVNYPVRLYQETWKLMDDWYTTSTWTPYWKNTDQIQSFSPDVKLGLYQKPNGETLILAANVSTEAQQGDIVIVPEALGLRDGHYRVLPVGPGADKATTLTGNRISVKIPRRRCRFFQLQKESSAQ